MIVSAAVCLDDIELMLFVGVHEHEKAAQQRYVISARVEVDAATVSPDAFFDYDPLKSFIDGFAGQRIETHEEIALRIWDFLKKDDRVRAVSLKLRKPDIFDNAAAVGLDISFAR